MSIWYELVIEGREEVIRWALPMAGPEGEGAIWGEDLDLHAGSFPDRIRDWLGRRSHYVVFVSAARVGDLVRNVRENAELRLEHAREVVRGHFAFRSEAYSRDLAAKIKEALHTPPPAGVRLEDSEEEENVDPEAKGVELYTPTHDYTYRARGRFTGPPPGIFEIHRRLRALDFVDQEKLELEGRQVALEELG